MGLNGAYQEDSTVATHLAPDAGNMHKHLSFTLLLVPFSYGALLLYLVYLVLTVIVLYFRLITRTV